MIYQILGFVILPALIAAFFASVIPRKHKEKEIFNKAASTFKIAVLSQLEGIYPITHYWDNSVYYRLRQSIIKVETAATIFKDLIPDHLRIAYDEALKNYCDYCNKANWVDMAANSLYHNTTEPDKNPREEFKNIVEHLISFANKK